MNYRRIVPNSISALSLILGIVSICKTFEGDFFWAPVCIILAMLADSLDGRAARLLNCPSPFGIQLDSLCDLGSFGVAPAIMIYQYGLTEWGLAGQIVAALFTVGGAMRLARFNVNSDVVHGYFQGMPIPAGATCLATYVLSGYHFSTEVVAVLTLVVAVILYSNVKFPDCKGKGNPLSPLSPVAVGIGAGVGVYLLTQNFQGWAFAAMCAYTVAGIVNFVLELSGK